MYYIYEIWNKTDNEPIYVGYSKGNPNGEYKRFETHLKEAIRYKAGRITSTKKLNMYKINTILKILAEDKELEYRFPYTELGYDEVCEKEKYLISLYGRKIENKGPLTNLDSGGRGGMSRCQETKDKLSDSLKGKHAWNKGKTLGPYDERRVLLAKQGYKDALSGPEGDTIRKNISESQKGKVLSEKHKKSISETLKGRPSPMKGKTPWNKGLTKKTDNRIATYAKKSSATRKENPRVPWNKGKTTKAKGRSYEEIYGKEVADRMKLDRSNTAWINDGTTNKKIKLTELDIYLNRGWIRGRIMPKRK